jgi:hypothetical protein
MKTTKRSSTSGAKLGTTILTGLTLTLLGVAPVEAAKVQENKIDSCGTTISAPGTYVVTRDLECAGDGIIIAAPGVHLNGNSRVISGSWTGTGIVVLGQWETWTDVHINNLDVRYFETGLLVQDADGVSVTNFESHRNIWNGIEVAYSWDVRIGAVISSENGSNGIALVGTRGSLIDTGNYLDNNYRGIEIDADSHYNEVVANHVERSGAVDAVDLTLPDCANAWQSNEFVTDNEGDGPSAGMIQ